MILICSSCRASCLFFVPSDKHQLLEDGSTRNLSTRTLSRENSPRTLMNLRWSRTRSKATGSQIANELPMVLDELVRKTVVFCGWSQVPPLFCFIDRKMYKLSHASTTRVHNRHAHHDRHDRMIKLTPEDSGKGRTTARGTGQTLAHTQLLVGKKEFKLTRLSTRLHDNLPLI
jgi:hypothetical protein